MHIITRIGLLILILVSVLVLASCGRHGPGYGRGYGPGHGPHYDSGYDSGYDNYRRPYGYGGHHH